MILLTTENDPSMKLRCVAFPEGANCLAPKTLPAGTARFPGSIDRPVTSTWRWLCPLGIFRRARRSGQEILDHVRPQGRARGPAGDVVELEVDAAVNPALARLQGRVEEAGVRARHARQAVGSRGKGGVVAEQARQDRGRRGKTSWTS